MKRICIGLLTALGCIAVATALIVRPFSQKSIQSYVLRNQDELTNYARKVIEFVTAQATGGFLGKFMLQLYDRML